MTISYILPTEAKDIMTTMPLSISAFQTVHEAVLLMTEKKVSALPVVDKESRPIGVLSQKDILRFDRENSEYPLSYQDSEQVGSMLEANDSHVENADLTKVEEIMTPLVFSVSPNTPTQQVIEIMLEKSVHRLFVVNIKERLVGVISTLDILKHLKNTF